MVQECTCKVGNLYSRYLPRQRILVRLDLCWQLFQDLCTWTLQGGRQELTSSWHQQHSSSIRNFTSPANLQGSCYYRVELLEYLSQFWEASLGSKHSNKGHPIISRKKSLSSTHGYNLPISRKDSFKTVLKKCHPIPFPGASLPLQTSLQWHSYCTEALTRRVASMLLAYSIMAHRAPTRKCH